LKEPDNEIMPKVNNSVVQDARNRPLAYIVQVVGVLVILLNLWLATKLVPLEKNIVVNAQQIRGIEMRLDRIEDKIDRLLLEHH